MEIYQLVDCIKITIHILISFKAKEHEELKKTNRPNPSLFDEDGCFYTLSTNDILQDSTREVVVVITNNQLTCASFFIALHLLKT